MVSKYKYQNVTWIDLESPNAAEVRDIQEEFDLPEPVTEELATCTLRSKADFYERQKLSYLVLHFPIVGRDREHVEQEIDFVIGKNFIITTHYEKIDPLHDFSRIFEKSALRSKTNIGEHAGFMFIYLMKELYKDSLERLEDVNDSLKNIEENIFKGKQTESVSVISNTNRKYLNFKQALRHHGEVLKSFAIVCEEMFGEKFKHQLDVIDSEYNRVRNTLEVGKEILNDLRETNDSLLTTKTNQTMKTLTAMTFTLLPITLITGIFGMNVTDNVLLIQNWEDFFLVLFFMILVGLIMFVWFKGKKWL